MDDLRGRLAEHGPGVIVVDSVYSVSGSRCPLPTVAQLAQEGGCVLVVDESHSLGTHGTDGEGLVRSLGLNDRVHFVTASLAKAFAYRAGFIACAARYVEFLRFNAFPAIFSSTLLEHEVARLDATLDVIAGEPQRRERLWRNTRQLRAGIASIGYDISNGSEQIIGIRSGAIPSAIALRDAMESLGVYGSPFWYPATDWRDAVMRLTVNAALTTEHIDRVLNALEHALPIWRASRKPAARLRTEASMLRCAQPTPQEPAVSC
jgi:CAI-1 autoinducer synthase